MGTKLLKKKKKSTFSTNTTPTVASKVRGAQGLVSVDLDAQYGVRTTQSALCPTASRSL